MSAFGGKADIIQGKADIKKCLLLTQSGHRSRSYQNNRARVMNDREEAMSEIGLEMQPTKLRRSEQRAIIL